MTSSYLVYDSILVYSHITISIYRDSSICYYIITETKITVHNVHK